MKDEIMGSRRYRFLMPLGLAVICCCGGCDSGGNHGNSPPVRGKFVEIPVPSYNWVSLRGAVFDPENRPTVLLTSDDYIWIMRWTGGPTSISLDRDKWHEDLFVPATDYGVGTTDFMNLVQDEDGEPMVVFRGSDGKEINFYGATGKRIYLNVLEPQDTWRAPVSPIPQGARQFSLLGNDKVQDGYYFLVEDHNGQVHFGSYSGWWGDYRSMSAPELVPGSARSPRIAGGYGNLYVAYLDQSVGGRVRLVRSVGGLDDEWTDYGLMSDGPVDLVSVDFDPAHSSCGPLVAYRDPSDGNRPHLVMPDHNGGFYEWNYGNSPLAAGAVTELVLGITVDGPIVGFVDDSSRQLTVAVWNPTKSQWNYAPSPTGGPVSRVYLEPRSGVFIFRDEADAAQRSRVMCLYGTHWEDMGYPLETKSEAAVYAKARWNGSLPHVAMVHQDGDMLKVTVHRQPNPGWWEKIAEMPEPATVPTVSLLLEGYRPEDLPSAIEVGYIGNHDMGDGPVARMYHWSSNRWMPRYFFDYDYSTLQFISGAFGNDAFFSVIKPGLPPYFTMVGTNNTIDNTSELHIVRGEKDGYVTDLGIVSHLAKNEAVLAITSGGEPVVAYHELVGTGAGSVFITRFDERTSTWQEIDSFSHARLGGLVLTSQDQPVVLLVTGDTGDTSDLKIMRLQGDKWNELGAPSCDGDYANVVGAAMDRRDRLFVLYTCHPAPLTTTYWGARLDGTRWEEPAGLFGPFLVGDGQKIDVSAITFTSDDVPVVVSTYSNDVVSQPMLLKYVNE